jgi:hypothetical protein
MNHLIKLDQNISNYKNIHFTTLNILVNLIRMIDNNYVKDLTDSIFVEASKNIFAINYINTVSLPKTTKKVKTSIFFFII